MEDDPGSGGQVLHTTAVRKGLKSGSLADADCEWNFTGSCGLRYLGFEPTSRFVVGLCGVGEIRDWNLTACKPDAPTGRNRAKSTGCYKCQELSERTRPGNRGPGEGSAGRWGDGVGCTAAI
jgi:hypothetical protein